MTRSPRARVLVVALVFVTTSLGCTSHLLVPGQAPLVYGPKPKPIVPEQMVCDPNATVATPVVTPSSPTNPIIGAADYHLHQFANLGFGGQVVWGDSYHPGGISQALSSCGSEATCLDARELRFCKVICRFDNDPHRCRVRCDRKSCGGDAAHGRRGILDPVGFAKGQGLGHDVHGYPSFQGWPHWNTYTHQQVYYRWLKRAFDGGLKLIVMLAVHNEVLCKFLDGSSCSDMVAVKRQLAAAYELERQVDLENDCQRNGNGWYRIARNPEQARRIIDSGAMAVVLGMEVDNPFDCYRDRKNCSAQYVRDQVAAYRELGVTHMFPIHLFDNAFGGTAADSEFFNWGTAIVNPGKLLDVRDCSLEPEKYEFKFGDPSTEVHDVLSLMARKFNVDFPPYEPMGAHCNIRGLELAANERRPAVLAEAGQLTKEGIAAMKGLGPVAIKAMMDAGMVIDVDHMSTRARADVLAMAEVLDYRGLVSGHAGFTELYKGDKKHEGQLRREEVDALLAQGGLLAPLLNEGGTDTVLQYARESEDGPRVPNDCGNSAKSFAQAYLYAVDKMKKLPDRRTDAVAFGSDLNGLAGMPTPRFGPFACGGQVDAPQGTTKDKVHYPIRIYPGANPTLSQLDRMQAGNRVFDINVDGFANIGMFPDFVAELTKVGVSDADLLPLFHGAEAYIQLWERAVERAEQASAPPPPPP